MSLTPDRIPLRFVHGENSISICSTYTPAIHFPRVPVKDKASLFRPLLVAFNLCVSGHISEKKMQMGKVARRAPSQLESCRKNGDEQVISLHTHATNFQPTPILSVPNIWRVSTRPKSPPWGIIDEYFRKMIHDEEKKWFHPPSFFFFSFFWSCGFFVHRYAGTWWT